MSPTNRSDDVHLISDLWDQAVNQFDVLAREGKLIHGPFTTTVRDEDGFKVAFQLAPHLNYKPVLPPDAPERKANHAKSNPFANPDPDFTLGSVGLHHTLLMNKFCVYRPSLLLITREYVPQYTALDASDIAATWKVLEQFSREQPAIPMLMFYNCGAESGSSQGHKHMQIMPHPRVENVKFELFPTKATSEQDIAESLEHVPHKHFVLRLPPNATLQHVTEAYEKLLARQKEVIRALGSSGDERPSNPPHNVVMTAGWICLIPRRHSGADRATMANALGMLGVAWTTRLREFDLWVEESGSIRNHLEYLGHPV